MNLSRGSLGGDRITTTGTGEPVTASNVELVTTNNLNATNVQDGIVEIYTNLLNLVVPIGAIIAYHKTLVESYSIILLDHFLECNGQTISDINSPLNGAVLPNINGENASIIGGSADDNTGSFIGDNLKTLQLDNLPSHGHTMDISGSHIHTGATASEGAHSHNGTTTNDGVHQHTHSFIPAPFGGAGAVPNTSSITALQGVTSTEGEHNHDLNIDNATDHNHALLLDTAGDHTHNINQTGAGQAFDNRPRMMKAVWIIRIK